MHRSGTSAIAGHLDTLGINGGKSLMNAAYDNPGGFYENTIINDINKEILDYNNTHWSDVNAVSLNWNSSHIAKAKKAIQDQYGSASDVYLKDPQLSLLLQFWIDVFNSLSYRICHVFVIRHPSEIVSSLARRNNFSEEKSKVLIQKYWVSALSLLIEDSFVILDYSEVLSNPKLILKKLTETFGWVPAADLINASNINVGFQNNLAQDSDAPNPDNYLYRLYNQIKNLSDIEENSTSDLRKLLSEDPKGDLGVINKKALSELEFAKVFYNTGDGYNEREAAIVQHDGHRLAYEFQYPKEHIVSIRLIPIHRAVLLSISKLDLIYNGGLVDYKFTCNGESTNDKKYSFVDRVPAFDIAFDKPVSIDELKVEINFYDVPDSYNTKNESATIVKSKTALFVQSLILFVSQPFALLKHINGQNIRTLRSALRRENPQTIYRNIKKLISSGSADQPARIEERHIINTTNISTNEFSNSNIIIYICGEVPEYDKSSGAQRADKILSIISESARLFVFYNKVSHPKYIEYFTQKGIELYPIDTIKRRYKQIANNVISVIFNKYYTYQDYNSILKYFPRSKIVIDAEDVAWVREERSQKYTDLTTRDIARNKDQEIEAYKAADLLWCVTQEDTDQIKTVLAQADIKIVSNIHQNTVSEFRQCESNSILFFANYIHEPNVTALAELVDVIFPIVIRNIPTATLLIAGSAIEKVEHLIPKDHGINVIGYVEHEDIPELYDSAALVIAPLKFGSGIKGKITESISYKIPVITNAIGNEGINLVDKLSGFVTEDSKLMAQYAIDIFSKKYDLKLIAENAYKKMEALTSYDLNKVSIIDSLFTKVSICIVTYNQSALLKSCIDSILNNTAYPNYEILIYSNGCNDGTRGYLDILQENYTNVKTIISDSNKVFVEPNNDLIELADHNDVVLLNNDVEVHRGWLSELCHIARLNDACGIVGAKIIYPDGRLQEYGSEIYANGSGANIGKGDDPNVADYKLIKSVPYVSGCCMYIKRTTIDRIGSLDMRYAPCYFEDSDYCYTAWKNDIMTLISPKSIITHYEGASAGNDESKGFKKYQAINREKFLSKHGHDIAYINKKAHSKSQLLTTSI